MKKTLLLLLSGLLVSCGAFTNSIDDVKSTRFHALDTHKIGSGSVWIASKSTLRGAYPSGKEKDMVEAVKRGLNAHGYSITSSRSSADFVFLCQANVKAGATSSYSVYEDSVVANQRYLHMIKAALMTNRKGSTAGKDLWEASSIESWGHPNIDSGRMFSVLMEKFPN